MKTENEITEYISEIRNKLNEYRDKRNNICILRGYNYINKYLELLSENKTEYAYNILSEFISDEFKFMSENDY